ncbi:nucleotidyltransferase family protein [Acetobacter indonesiensis]|uniref:nucleotidyltransferase family protein n=1 Tax=Acetobacter indonesiensis TaxID=104101 RepID=UPI0020A4A670|nr:nucleotidyltransferase family protein [Acetobacter indonesiensis]MCP1230421.1 nucleotidyltransferase family protein [Acetobacter indonesiensis]
MVTTTAPFPVALILAAGRSSRTAPAHKLLVPDAAGRAMLVRTTHHVLGSNVGQVLVVVPPDKPELQSLLQDAFPHTEKLGFCVAQDAALGLSASLRAGVNAAEKLEASSVLVCLGDMPLVSTELLNSLLAEQNRMKASAVAPDRGGRPGNPVVWDKSQFPALKQVEGDKGGRTILQKLGCAVHLVPAPLQELVDFDTPERLAAYARLG